MEFMDVLKNRYSCKKYDGIQITKEELEVILEAGRLAPTAKNNQEQHIYVVQSAEELAKIDSLTPCRYGAPTVLIVAFDKNNTFTYPGQKYDSGIEDAAIVTTHMLLAAKSVGVESCWVNFFDPDKVKEAFNLPENEDVLTFVDLGYAADGAGPLANHDSRKPLADTVSYL
ncbi:nitroreductase family protein [Oribacterium sp. P6A1]|uniref:nitroreductase family protein n=1 Tax=Oribacterium sp. P6A1 TaxID=1410612 RepID=UPI000559FD99|nr:nitroreductase family protein [Oribacterium sp. P6A1]